MASGEATRWAPPWTSSFDGHHPLSADQESEDDPERFAQEAGLDPTAQEVDEYRELVGDTPSADQKR